MREHGAVIESLGAYVLGALSGTERAEVTTHLAECAACRAELAGLAGLPGLLAQLDATDVEHLDSLSTTLPERLLVRALQELRRRRGRQRRRALVSAAALVIAAVLGTIVTVAQNTGEHSASVGRTVAASNPTTGVHGELQLRREPWGTALHLTLRGVPPGTHCTLLTVLKDGHRQVSGAWQASYDGAASIDAVADASPDLLRGVQVLDARGQTVVSISLVGS